jgi:hypothetical protein
MDEPIHQISGNLNIAIQQIFKNRLPVCSLTLQHLDFNEGAHKYILENNLIVYEKYDRHGRLVSRVPWSNKTTDEIA